MSVRPHRFPATGRLLAGVALSVAVLTLVGCSDDGNDTVRGSAGPSTTSPTTMSSAAAATATFEASDYQIAGPADVPAGLTTITARNTGAESHHLVFARVEEGRTQDDFTAAFAALDPTGVATLLGGPTGIAPGATGSATIPLTAGEYVVACFIPGPDGISHYVKGMSTQLTVTPSDAGAELPPADRTLDLDEYQFGRGDGELGDFDGTGTILVTNRGEEIHEMTIVRLRDGADIDDVVDVASLPMGTPRPDPLPFEGVGGVSLLSPGQSGWVDLDALDLGTGRYALVCFIPSPVDRVAHAAKGMVFEFAV
jgi:uncharacterized cupredoxin-like copper-binding protein